MNTTAKKLEWPPSFPGVPFIDEQEERAVMDVIRSRSLFRYYGPAKPTHVDAYEDAARKFYGVKHAIAVNSGTGALITSMSALGVGPGTEVIVPAFMWVSTISAVVQCNAIPVLCEIDESFTMDVRDLERKITPRTKLIVPVHMCGAPSRMDAIMELARKKGIDVLEDCAQCNGGSFGGKKVGSIGRMGIFSLQLNKNMTTGEGGLLITDDDTLAARAFAAHDMGMTRVDGKLAEPAPGALMWGTGRRMNELCGAIANVQISKLPRIVADMRASKDRIKSKLRDVPGLKFRRLNDPAGDTAAAMIMVLDDESATTSALEKMRAAGLGATRVADFGLHIYHRITALVQKTPLSSAGNPWSLPENRKSVYDYAKGACPITDALLARSILVGMPSKLAPDKADRAADVIREALAPASVVA